MQQQNPYPIKPEREKNIIPRNPDCKNTDFSPGRIIQLSEF